MNSTFRLMISILVGVALAALIAFGRPASHETVIADNGDGKGGAIGAPFGGSLAGLTDANGNTIPEDAFKGKYELVFFGFTFCPAICPTELQKFTKIIQKLDPAERDRLAPIFVTIDPERDTPKTLKAYGASFDPSIVMLTGTPEAIDRVKVDWKVYAAKVEMPGSTDYMMNHSSFTYLRAPDGTLAGLFGTDDKPETLLDEVQKALTQP